MVDIGFSTILAINLNIMSQIEENKLNWDDHACIDSIKKKFILNAVSSAAFKPNQTVLNNDHNSRRANNTNSSYSNKGNPCSQYNLGKCQSHWSHKGTNGTFLKHICSYCYSRGNPNTNHPEIQCRQKTMMPPTA